MGTTIDVDGQRYDAEALLRAIDKADCEESLYTFLQYAWRYVDSSTFTPGWPLEAVCEHLQYVVDGEIKRLIINIPPRCSKPISRFEYVQTLELGVIRLGDVAVGMHVLTHRGRFKAVTAVHRQGQIPVVKVTTRRGRELVAAPDHPILTTDGWKNAGDLIGGDIVGVVPQFVSGGLPTISEEEARLLGYLIGDGCCTAGCRITVADDIERADIEDVVFACGMTPARQDYAITKTGGVLGAVSVKSSVGHRSGRPSKGYIGQAKEFLIKHGLLGKSSYTKMVPEAVLRGNESVVRNFVAAYWACDGFVTVKGAKRNGDTRDDLVIGCDSVNKAFLRQMQVLLLRLGIDCTLRKKVAKIKTKAQGDSYTSYTLVLSDQDNCWRFASQITIRHAKGAKLAAARRRRFDFDRQIVGDEVVSVEDAGRDECLCLTVDEDESFVASGIAVHNSTITSICFPAWTWAQPMFTPTSGPGVPFLCGSYAEKLALRDSVKCRRLIESPWYQSLWGDRFKLTTDQNTKSRFENDKGGTRLITSVEAAVTGEGGNCFVAGTMVSTPTGPVAIENLVPGDTVLAFDFSLGRVVGSDVLAWRARRSNDIREIHTNAGHRIRCTADHPIFVEGRGFVRADQLGAADRLIVEERSPCDDQSALRMVRGASEEAALRNQEGSQAEFQGCVLLQRPLSRTPRNQEQSEVRGVRRSPSISSPKILQHRLLAHGQPTPKNILMRALRTTIRAASRALSILFEALRGYGSFATDGWGGKFSVQPYWGQVLRASQSNAEGGQGARREQMCRLREGTAQNKRSAWEEERSSHASYRREPSEQRSGEPRDDVHQVPSNASHIGPADIERIVVDRSQEVDVYDIQVEGQSNFFAEGILAHNCIILDDPNNATDVMSEATIEATIEWWSGALSTRLNDPKTGAYIIIQQRLGEQDLTGYLLENEVADWVHLVVPMRYEPERSYHLPVSDWKDPRTTPGELMWPERFGETEVSDLEKRLGPWRAAGNLQQRPEPKGGGIIKRDWWNPWEQSVYPPMDYILASLDTAHTTKEENDPSAMTIWGVYSGQGASTAQILKSEIGGRVTRTFSQEPPRLMMMYAWQDRLEIHQLIHRVVSVCRQMKVDKLIIENKARGHEVAQELRRLFQNENFMVQLIDPKGTDKMARLYSVQHIFSEGMVTAPDKEWAEMVIAQCGTFPRGKHDDLVDTVSQALRHLRDLGLLQRATEVAYDEQQSKLYRGPPPPPLYGVP